MSDCVPPAALIARSKFFSVKKFDRRAKKVQKSHSVYKGQILKRGTRLLSLIDSVIISGATAFRRNVSSFAPGASPMGKQ